MGFDGTYTLDEKLKEKSKSSKISKLAIGTLTLFLAYNTTYESIRPTITGKVLGGKFSNNTPSEIYVSNQQTNTIDTLYLGTDPAFEITMGRPETFKGRAEELKEKLTPGTLIQANLYKNNKIYSFENIQLDEKPHQNTKISFF
ncbi:MAG: hypothetical protein ACLFN8_01955 [Candidatus Woesearchaeota archaeon]